MLARYLPVLALIAPLVFGDVKFTSPDAGTSLKASGGTVKISAEWEDSGDSPSLADLATYSVYLYAGGNTAGTYQQIGGPLATGKSFSAGNTVSASVPTTAGGDIDNAYFLQIISVPKTGGGTVMNFSPRFSLSGMTGSFPAAIKTAAQGVTGTAGPNTQNAVIGAGVNQAAVAPQGSYAVNYADQDGPTKYAPMVSQPGTKITAKTASARYPTSSVSFYKTYAPIPKQVTTQTMSQTFTVSSVENSATPAAQPKDDMQKFLNRWKD